jgi:hypothetical protein
MLIALFSADVQKPEEAPKQPIAFSHAYHAGTLKLACAGCHVNPKPGEMMTFPAEAKCMACHATAKTESAEIQRLAKFAADRKKVPWVRVYQIPTYVFWSHQTHLEAGGKCADCHGAVEKMTNMYREVAMNMGACMSCHAKKQVSNDCQFCHEKVN